MSAEKPDLTTFIEKLKTSKGISELLEMELTFEQRRICLDTVGEWATRQRTSKRFAPTKEIITALPWTGMNLADIKTLLEPTGLKTRIENGLTLISEDDVCEIKIEVGHFVCIARDRTAFPLMPEIFRKTYTAI